MADIPPVFPVSAKNKKGPVRYVDPIAIVDEFNTRMIRQVKKGKQPAVDVESAEGAKLAADHRLGVPMRPRALRGANIEYTLRDTKMTNFGGTRLTFTLSADSDRIEATEPLARAMVESRPPGVGNSYAIIRFVEWIDDGDDFRQSFKSFPITADSTIASISKLLRKVSVDGTTGRYSDAPIGSLDIDIGWFQTLTIAAPVGRGLSKKAKNNLTLSVSLLGTAKVYDTPSADDNCLFACLRATAGGKFKGVQVRGMRRRSGVPDGGVSIDSLQDVASNLGIEFSVYYGCTREIIPEDDLSKHGLDRYTCSVFVRKEVWSSRGADDESPCLCLEDEHYTIFSELKELKPGKDYCKKTGVSLIGRGPLSEPEIFRELICQGRYHGVAHQGPQKRLTGYTFWDIETVHDQTGECYLKAYSVAYVVTTLAGVTTQQDVLIGRDCMSRFIDMLESIPPTTLVSYNGSRFDHLALLSEALIRPSTGVQRLFMTRGIGGGVLGMTLAGGHTVFDLCRFTPGLSLASLGNAFKTEHQKIPGFSHMVPQSAFNEGGEEGLIKWCADNAVKLEEYNLGDCLALQDAFFIMKKTVSDACGLDITKFMTIAGLSLELHKQSIKNTSGTTYALKTPVPKNEEDDKFIRSSIVAGRTQAFEGSMTWDGPISFFDVVSMYPAMMLQREFPNGPYTHTIEYVEGKMGIYSVTVVSQPTPAVIAKRGDESLDWTPECPFETTATSVDINRLRAEGGVCAVHMGIYWDKAAVGAFPSLEMWKAVKQKEDLKPKAERNGALRAVAKISLNALSGKVIQRVFAEDSTLVRCRDDYARFQRDHHDISIELGNSDWFMISGTKNVGWSPRAASPAYLGCFIYSYAREHLYAIAGHYNAIYTDTDSAALRKVDAERALKECPGLFVPEGAAKSFGEWEVELETGDAGFSAFIRPKLYIVIDSNIPRSSWKIRAAGVRQSDIPITEEQAARFRNSTPVELFNHIRDATTSFGAMTFEEYKAMYTDLNAGRPRSFLTSSIRKNLKPGEISLSQHFTIKTLQL